MVTIDRNKHVEKMPCPDNPIDQFVIWNSTRGLWECPCCQHTYSTIEEWEEAFGKKSDGEFTKNLSEYITPLLKGL